jgi:energy-coupling factor transporter ATP-binding protein EcfA2
VTELLRTERLRELLSELHRLVAQRAPADVEIIATFTAQARAAEKQYQETQKDLADRNQQQRTVLENQCAVVRREAVTRFQADHSAARREYDEVRQYVAEQLAADAEAAKRQIQEAQWEAATIFEATRKGLDAQIKESQAQLVAQGQSLDWLHQQAVEILRRRRQWRSYADPEKVATVAPADAARRLGELTAQANRQLRGLAQQATARLFEGAGLFGLFLAVTAACVVPAGFALRWNDWPWIPVGLGSGLAVWSALAVWLYRLARRQSASAYRQLRQTLLEAQVAHRVAGEAVRAQWEQQTAAITATMNREVQQAQERFDQQAAAREARRRSELEGIESKYPALLAAIVARRDADLAAAEETCSAQTAAIAEGYRDRSEQVTREFRQAMADLQEQYHGQWEAMSGRWHGGMDRLQRELDAINADCGRVFPPWTSPDLEDWKPPAEMCSAVPFGRLHVDLQRIPNGVPADDRLKLSRTQFTMPAAFPFRDHALLLLKAGGEGRGQAVATMQAIMLRLLTSMPPGKVRFAIVDPVGLGENFSAFMHLADYNEQLVTNRIWTNTQHIEERLGELTGHMENVIQVYLRNEFASIQEYNAFAGEMAEAYRILVVANFPTNFSEGAARRLLSIVASGARCGVYTLLSVDTRLKMPREFHLPDLEKQALNLVWQDDHFVWQDRDFAQLPLELDGPPAAEQFTRIVRSVGQHVQDADRIEVPFEAVLPDDGQWWTADSRGGLDVPLGRAGAMKLQHLLLGKGTSQHVLISGKTGSGKSTLLHALVTNLAIRYSPEEVELYLVDFKKGVEFKAYAQAELPHARVIAIESEREFGLSVLERLDLELKRRGDLFRNQGVQDLHAFRNARPELRLPRVMLIVDEFQELFVEDDRIAQNASLLLDRLVRQGRAFGIHVLLGSQTLAGAYSLPRSTIGQMAVRIALQCSEADAHLILSEENTAARLLNRPGEAIYNDANGLFEGNHPFQVVWLADEKKEAYLQRIREMARQRKLDGRPPIVFEGNLPADPAKNVALQGLLSASCWPEPATAARAWLGAAVAIKDPTSILFSRQSGNHFLVVGHQEDEALGVLATALLSLAAQHAPADVQPGGTPCKGVVSPATPDVPDRAIPQGPADTLAPAATPVVRNPGAARFYVLDGTRPDSPSAGYWGRLAAALPHGVKVFPPRSTGATLAEISEELARREQSGGEDFPPLYLFVFDLGRFRDLRKADDDFGFSRSDDGSSANPAKQFSTILHDGPAQGIHVLIWCDSYNNVQRQLDRQSLHDIELKAVFQMNANDSSSFIDTPAAGQLGVHRGLLYSEADGLLEKFRPYGPPSEELLRWIQRQFQSRAASASPFGRAPG